MQQSCKPSCSASCNLAHCCRRIHLPACMHAARLHSAHTRAQHLAALPPSCRCQHALLTPRGLASPVVAAAPGARLRLARLDDWLAPAALPPKCDCAAVLGARRCHQVLQAVQTTRLERTPACAACSIVPRQQLSGGEGTIRCSLERATACRQCSAPCERAMPAPATHHVCKATDGSCCSSRSLRQ